MWKEEGEERARAAGPWMRGCVAKLGRVARVRHIRSRSMLILYGVSWPFLRIWR